MASPGIQIAGLLQRSEMMFLGGLLEITVVAFSFQGDINHGELVFGKLDVRMLSCGHER